jgi:sirohydrochlorin cobaltochelatase
MKALILFGHGARMFVGGAFDRLANLWKLIPMFGWNYFEHAAQFGRFISDYRLIKRSGECRFFGQGGHCAMISTVLDVCQQQFPDIALSATPAVGEMRLSCKPLLNLVLGPCKSEFDGLLGQQFDLCLLRFS